jgi:hypothetical protein
MQMAAGRNYQMCMGNARDVRERRSPIPPTANATVAPLRSLLDSQM